MELKRVFGNVMRELREKNAMTQLDLAEKSGYHKNYISLLETAQRQPSLETIFAIAKAFEMKPSELMARIENEMSS